jgi:DNA processing protein
LVTSVEDVLEVVGGLGETGAAGRTAPAAPGDVRSALDALDPLARRVYEGLRARRFERPEQIAVRSGVSPLEVIRALPALDLAGLLESGEAGYRIASRPRP